MDTQTLGAAIALMKAGAGGGSGSPGPPGKSPKIGEDGYWYIWNWDTMDWENTGVYAKGGISDYEELSNKPRINGVELSGDKSPGDLGLSKPITNSDIEALFVT